jgi:dihydropteroate synthase
MGGVPPGVDGIADLGRTLVMGVVNVTPDSFSDGGLHLDPDAAIAHGRALVADGADLVDVGGESTRPGAQRVSVAEEIRRVVPVISALAADGVVVSVDTMRAQTAAAALSAGARMVNDVSGGQADPDLPRVAADAAVPYVVMHWRDHSADMYAKAVYDDVVAEVRAELSRQVEAVVSAGVDPARIVIDPGIGFAKNAEHNWTLLAALDQLVGLGRPVLVGASRKSFLGALLATADGEPRAVTDRDDATVALTTIAAEAGVWAVRVHEVRANADAVRVVAATKATQ